MDWAVWYADGTSYTGPPESAPKTGVIVVMQREPEGVVPLLGRDFYLWRGDELGDRWFPADQFGLWEYLAEPGPKIVLFGRTVRTDRFRTIVRHAQQEGLDG